MSRPLRCHFVPALVIAGGRGFPRDYPPVCGSSGFRRSVFTKDVDCRRCWRTHAYRKALRKGAR